MNEGPILVTGGAGYIGSVVAHRLAKRGEEVVIVDDLSTGSRDAAGSLPLEVVDLKDAAALEEVVARHAPRAVMHFAAKLDVGESAAEPLLYYRTNVGGTLNLLAAMQKHGVRQLVFSSSSSVYGTPDTDQALTEDLLMMPISAYGRTKAMVEEILRDCAERTGFRYVALRYFNVAGFDAESPRNTNPYKKGNLMPVIARSIASGMPVQIYGDDYPTRDGTCVRDYIHVSDLADAHLRALDYLAQDGGSEIFNLGNGNGFTVREVIAAAGSVLGIEPQVEVMPRRAGDPAVSVADAGKARRVMGWEPVYGKLEDIVRSALS